MVTGGVVAAAAGPRRAPHSGLRGPPGGPLPGALSAHRPRVYGRALLPPAAHAGLPLGPALGLPAVRGGGRTAPGRGGGGPTDPEVPLTPHAPALPASVLFVCVCAAGSVWAAAGPGSGGTHPPPRRRRRGRGGLAVPSQAHTDDNRWAADPLLTRSSQGLRWQQHWQRHERGGLVFIDPLIGGMRGLFAGSPGPQGELEEDDALSLGRLLLSLFTTGSGWVYDSWQHRHTRKCLKEEAACRCR